MEKLSQWGCVLTPDFSLYLDMPMDMKIWNTYRSRQIGQIMQREGLHVIPSISWAEPETFSFCFDGIEPGGVVSVSTVGVKRNRNAMELWQRGMDEAMKRLHPHAVVVYGGDIDYEYPCKVIRAESEQVQRFRGMRER